MFVVFLLVFILLSLLLFRLEHSGKRIKLIIIIILGLIIFFSFMKFYNSSEMDLKTPIGIVKTGIGYGKWVGHSVVNLWEAKDDIVKIVGDAVSNGG